MEIRTLKRHVSIARRSFEHRVSRFNQLRNEALLEIVLQCFSKDSRTQCCQLQLEYGSYLCSWNGRLPDRSVQVS